MDRQTIVEKVHEHFITSENPPAVSNEPNGPAQCLYRTRDGSKCAVGILIPDELYQPDMENNPASDMLTQFGDLYRHIGIGGAGDLSFLDELQSCHDTAALDARLTDYDDFRGTLCLKLRHLCLQEGLNYPGAAN